MCWKHVLFVLLHLFLNYTINEIGDTYNHLTDKERELNILANAYIYTGISSIGAKSLLERSNEIINILTWNNSGPLK